MGCRVGHSLASLTRHAERFGTEQVFETAQEYLSPEDLAKLAQRMRKLPADPTLPKGPRWSLSGDQTRALFNELRTQVPLAKLADYLGVSRRTVLRWEKEENGL